MNDVLWPIPLRDRVIGPAPVAETTGESADLRRAFACRGPCARRRRRVCAQRSAQHPPMTVRAELVVTSNVRAIAVEDYPDVDIVTAGLAQGLVDILTHTEPMLSAIGSQ